MPVTNVSRILDYLYAHLMYLLSRAPALINDAIIGRCHDAIHADASPKSRHL